MGIQNQSLVEILRSTIEAWRTAQHMTSREAIAIAIVEAHLVHAAGGAKEISFEFAGSDVYDRAKKSAQKIFRWLDEGNLPANMIPSILAALPAEHRIAALNQILCPMGIEARSVDQAPAIGFDTMKHLRSITKEGADAKMALLTVSPDAGDAELLDAHRELAEAEQAYGAAKDDLMAKIIARQALAQMRTSSQST